MERESPPLTVRAGTGTIGHGGHIEAMRYQAEALHQISHALQPRVINSRGEGANHHGYGHLHETPVNRGSTCSTTARL